MDIAELNRSSLRFPGNTVAVAIGPVTNAVMVSYCSFAIDGVVSLSLSAMTFAQELVPAPT
jgi:hypothetical protein